MTTLEDLSKSMPIARNAALAGMDAALKKKDHRAPCGKPGKSLMNSGCPALNPIVEEARQVVKRYGGKE